MIFVTLTLFTVSLHRQNGVLDSLLDKIIEICSVFPFVRAKYFDTQDNIKT